MSELQALAPQVAIVLIFAGIMVKLLNDNRKERQASENRYSALIKGHQDLLAHNTEAITNMYIKVDQVVEVNGRNQQKCAIMQEGFKETNRELRTMLRIEGKQ